MCEFAEQKTVIIEDIKFVREMAKKEVVIMEQMNRSDIGKYNLFFRLKVEVACSGWNCCYEPL